MICIYCLHIYLPTYLGSLANDDVEEGENDERKHKSCFAFGILSLCLPISSLILMFDIWFFDMVIICYWQNLTIYISTGFQLCSQFYHVELYYLYTVHFIV